MADQTVLTWVEIEKNLRQRLAQVDARLRRAKSDDALILQGRAQVLEELLNLPETMKVGQEETRNG